MFEPSWPSRESYQPELIFTFFSDINGIKTRLPAIFSPDTSKSEIEKIKEAYPPRIIDIRSEFDYNQKIRKNIDNYAQRAIEITSVEKLAQWQITLYSRLLSEFLKIHPQESNNFYHKEKLEMPYYGATTWTVSTSFGDLPPNKQQLMANFVKTFDKNLLFEVIAESGIFWYTKVFEHKYIFDTDASFINALEEQFISQQQAFFKGIFGNLTQRQKSFIARPAEIWN